MSIIIAILQVIFYINYKVEFFFESLPLLRRKEEDD